MTDAGGSGPPPAGSTSEQLLRVTLEKNTKPELIEKCKEAGISGYTKKRKEELIDLLVFKKSRLDEQVAHWMPPICAVCALRLCPLVPYCDPREIMQARPLAQRAAAPPVATAPDPAPVATEESTGNEEASVHLRFLSARAVKLCAALPLYAHVSGV